ncbi:MAG TPA: LD-carboxypeptidase [Rhizomicrobium sp.]|jgi:muramoyltetrapeptide carboxypeptidase
MGKVKIGIMAPACRLPQAIADQATALAAAQFPDAELHFHPQCFLSSGHFAGDDAARTAAFLDIANDGSFDALWFARGGYGAGRIGGAVIAKLAPTAKRKTYLGYSDTGFLLAGLYKAGCTVAHGPMVHDLKRENGEIPAKRALDFLVNRAKATLEPSVPDGAPAAAFNMIILSMMMGTALEPDLADHVLMLEEVSEHLYAIDRVLFHLTSIPAIRKVAGIRFGRCSDIPENDYPFGQSVEEITRHWCAVSGIPYLGTADIGHDIENKVVPFGRWT